MAQAPRGATAELERLRLPSATILALVRAAKMPFPPSGTGGAPLLFNYVFVKQ